MPRIIRSINNLFKLWDPTFENLIFALEIVTPAVLAVLFWVYTQKPCTMLMITIAPVATMTTFNANKFNTKTRNLFLMFTSMGCGAFIISILSNYKTLLIVALCILVFFCYISSKYIFMSLTAWTVATFLTIPIGFYQGIDRLCEAGVSFLIALLSLLFYEFICGKIIMKASLTHISELLYDLFYISTETNKKQDTTKIYSKYLYNKDALTRVNLYGHYIFENDIDKFNYKIGSFLRKTDIIFTEKQFFFNKNFNYALTCLPASKCYRKLYRSMRFIENFRNRKDDILKILPETEKVIQDIRLNLKFISIFIKSDVKKNIEHFYLNEKWIKDFDDLSNKAGSIALDNDAYDICYGIKAILYELTPLYSSINNINTFL
jgi:hypothetical protein